MKTLDELKAFCEGYRTGAIYNLPNTDDWVVWGGYDINFAGSEYSSHAKTDNDLRVDAYRADWIDDIGEPLFSFNV